MPIWRYFWEKKLKKFGALEIPSPDACFCASWCSKGSKWGQVPRSEELGGASTLYSAI